MYYYLFSSILYFNSLNAGCYITQDFIWLLSVPFMLCELLALGGNMEQCIEEVWGGGQFVLYGWVWKPFRMKWYQNRSVFMLVPVKMPFIFCLANWEMLLFAARIEIKKKKQQHCCELPSCDVICSTQTEKYRSFPPPWSLRDAAAWQCCGNKTPGCMTHSFIKRWRLFATDLSEPTIKDEEGSSAKLLFIPAEYTMTRLWQKSSLQMTK